MHELVHRIIADATGMQAQRSVAQTGRRYSWNADIDRFSQHVLAMFSHAGIRRPRTQELIAPWSAIAADNVDLSIWPAQLRHQRMQQVKLLRVVMAGGLGPVVTKKKIQLCHGIGKVRVADSVHHVNIFAGVQMVQAQMIRMSQVCISIFRSGNTSQPNQKCSSQRRGKAELIAIRIYTPWEIYPYSNDNRECDLQFAIYLLPVYRICCRH